MIVSDSYKLTVAKLSDTFEKGEASSIARILYEDLCEISIPQLSEKVLDSVQMDLLENAIRSVLDGIPVDYVTGFRAFFGRNFQVSNDVLIPRQETEELVQWILDDLGRDRKKPKQILDIGTGSGCIPITLDLETNGAHQLYGMEISSEALSIALKNNDALSSNVSFYQKDVLEDSLDSHSKLDVIVSNPPYILDSERRLMNTQVLDHEPDIALFVNGNDPLLFYKAINQYALRHLNIGGVLYYEISALHKADMEALMRVDGFDSIETRKDISGNWRMIKAIKN